MGNKIKKLKFNPCISKELHDELLKNPKACQKLVAEERAMGIKLGNIIMKHLCSEEFLSGLFKKGDKK